MDSRIKLLLLGFSILLLSGCKHRRAENEYLRSLVYDEFSALALNGCDYYIYPTLQTKGSAPVTVCIYPSELLQEIAQEKGQADAREDLYQSLLHKRPIMVSEKFYAERMKYTIQPDSTALSIYQQEGPEGLIHRYFRNEGSLITIWKSPEIYSTSWLEPWERNDSLIDYIGYLLFQHNLFIQNTWIEAELRMYIILDTDATDISQIHIPGSIET